MTANKRTPVEHYERQTLPEATRADVVQLLDMLWRELESHAEQHAGQEFTTILKHSSCDVSRNSVCKYVLGAKCLVIRSCPKHHK